MPHVRWSLLVVAISALAAGCSNDRKVSPSVGEDAGIATAPDAGTEVPVDAGGAGPDAGEVEPDAGAPSPTMERLGGYVPAAPRSILTGKTTPIALYGSSPVSLDPSWFGLPSTPEGEEGWLRNALLVHETDTGRVRVIGAAEGMPTMSYGDYSGDYGVHPVPILDLDWVAADTVFVGAGYAKVIRGAFAADGALSFSEATVRAPAATEDAVVAYVRARAGELIVSTDQGIALLEADTLAPKGWVTGGDFDGVKPWGRQIAVSDAAAAILLARPDAAATRVAVLLPDTTAAITLDAPAGTQFTSVLGLPAGLLVGVKEADGRGAIYRLASSGTAWSLQPLITAETLAATELGRLVAHTLAYDETRAQLLVGGEIDLATTADPFNRVGRGIAVVDLEPDLTAGGVARSVVPMDFVWYGLLPWTIDPLTVDAEGRILVGGLQLCNEHRLRQLGVLRIERDGSEVRAVRPFVSGVHEIATEPGTGTTWLGLNDEAGGMQCDGANVQNHVCRLKADGSCEIYAPVNNIGLQPFSPVIAASAIAFGDPARKELAIAARGQSFVEIGDHSFLPMTTISPGISNRQTSAAWSQGSLWIGSRMNWETFEIPGVDNEAINDRSPHGLGLLEFAPDAAPLLERRYVRRLPEWSNHEDVAGLPSNDVRDVLPLDGARKALVACGIERDSESYDHLPGTPNAHDYSGGLAVVDDLDVKALIAPAEVKDVMALARRSDGTLFALDAQVGVLQVDVAGLSATVWAPAAWPAGERGMSLAVDGEGRVAVVTVGGLYVYGPDKVATKLAGAEHGTYWKVRFGADGQLLAGADQGLLRIGLEGGVLLPAGPEGLLSAQLWALPAPCGGRLDCSCQRSEDCLGTTMCLADVDGVHACAVSCSDELCPCRTTATCNEPLVCDARGVFAGGTCILPDPCAQDPGSASCACTEGSCNTGLLCDCSWGDCTCQVDPASCTAQTPCLCVDVASCPVDASWYCNQVQGECAQMQPCDAGCQCATDSGCSEGLECLHGFGGDDCVEASGPMGP